MAETVVVFDFDKTIIDGDSDRWVVDQMGVSELFNQLRTTLPWNALMDRMMKEVHSQGKTTKDIADCLRRAHLHPSIISAIQSARALGCELRILSDANHFFIETILKHHGLLECFSEINTNPSFIDEQGTRLRILPFHDFISSPHGCPRCPPHMCKGLVIERMRRTFGSKRRFIYVGDGSGDFCPTLKLEDKDFVMPRKHYPLWGLIQTDPSLVKAQIREWSDGDELQTILLHLITPINNHTA